ncbi:hypothetical protein [Streptomyces jumonjinensis]|uniref:hypothetical protein n=1 Tax=Streptomyces jumonjinensis TaxID=1945 RepID=UPI0037B9A22E
MIVRVALEGLAAGSLEEVLADERTARWKSRLDEDPALHAPPSLPCPGAALAATEAYWSARVSPCPCHGPDRDAVIRSLITLKARTPARPGDHTCTSIETQTNCRPLR